MRKKRSLSERLRKFVTPGKANECWEFDGSRHDFGYGLMRIEGKMVGAHRIAYTVGKGPIPQGKYVLHKCDNPPCCNPDHLYAGTQLNNVRDRNVRNRTAKGPGRAALQRKICRRGSDHQDAKLSEHQVSCIRVMYADHGWRQRELAVLYGVSQATISAMTLRKTWTHI